MNILFLCDTNTIKGPIAEALAQNYFLPEVNVQSAGLTPGPELHPQTVICVQEIGIDIENRKPRSIMNLHGKFLENIDYLIILGTDDIEVPATVNAKYTINWATIDPTKGLESQIQEDFQSVRDELCIRICDFSEVV